MPVKHYGASGRVTGFRPDDGESAALFLDGVNAACVEPALYETGRLMHPVRTRGVVGDQALREREQVRDCLLTLRYRDKSIDPLQVAFGDRDSGLSGLRILTAPGGFREVRL